MLMKIKGQKSMSQQLYDLEECLFDNPWLRSQMKEKCALPVGKNVLGRDIYAVREGVTIRALFSQ